MFESRPLHILFLVNFSDSNYRAIPALARIADELCVKLTLLHCYDPAKQSRSQAEQRLASFFPEADHYGGCRRLVMEGDPVANVEHCRRQHGVDLVIAPASDPLGTPRLGHVSLRCRLIRHSAAPVWTMGPKAGATHLNSPTRNVACWIDFDSTDTAHLKLAFEYAWKLDARLHLLHAIPDIDEGSLLLALSPRPLNVEAAVNRIREILGWTPSDPEIHVVQGGAHRAVLNLLRKCEADICFVGREQAIPWRWLGYRLNPVIDKSPCPLVCVGNASVPIWSLERGSAFLGRTELQKLVRMRG